MQDFGKDFNTILSPEDEGKFAAWKAKYAPQDSGADYDLRGAFRAGLEPDPETGHWPDTFKKPNHPTFSNESRYAAFGNPGRWEGERFIPGAKMNVQDLIRMVLAQRGAQAPQAYGRAGGVPPGAALRPLMTGGGAPVGGAGGPVMTQDFSQMPTSPGGGGPSTGINLMAPPPSGIDTAGGGVPGPLGNPVATQAFNPAPLDPGTALPGPAALSVPGASAQWTGPEGQARDTGFIPSGGLAPGAPGPVQRVPTEADQMRRSRMLQDMILNYMAKQREITYR